MMETTGVNYTQNTTGVNVTPPHPTRAVPSYEEYAALYSPSAQAPAQAPIQPVQQAPVHSAQVDYNKISVPADQAVQGVIAPPQPQPDISDDATNVITLKLDGESLKLLLDANEIFRETIVNLGIKLASETPVYKQYFKKEALRMTGNANGVAGTQLGAGVVNSNQMTMTTTSGSTTGSQVAAVNVAAEPVKKKSAGFGSWG